MATSMDIGGGGSASFPFDQVGDSVTGTIRDLEEVQQTDMTTNEPSVWPDGKPKMMYRVTLDTDLRDPADPTDDGERSVYLRGSKKAESQSSLAAVLAAVRQVTGGTNLAVGGRLTLTYIGNGVASVRGHNPPKFYSAQYQAPSVNLDGGAPVQQVQQQAPAQQVPQGGPQWPNQAPAPQWAQPPAPPVQQQAPAPAPAAQAPAAGGLTPEVLAALAAAGISPAALGG